MCTFFCKTLLFEFLQIDWVFLSRTNSSDFGLEAKSLDWRWCPIAAKHINADSARWLSQFSTLAKLVDYFLRALHSAIFLKMVFCKLAYFPPEIKSKSRNAIYQKLFSCSWGSSNNLFFYWYVAVLVCSNSKIFFFKDGSLT